MNRWESPTAQQLAASASETPTGYCPVMRAWRSLLYFCALRHGLEPIIPDRERTVWTEIS
jgi:hypothetical protein